MYILHTTIVFWHLRTKRNNRLYTGPMNMNVCIAMSKLILYIEMAQPLVWTQQYWKFLLHPLWTLNGIVGKWCHIWLPHGRLVAGTAEEFSTWLDTSTASLEIDESHDQKIKWERIWKYVIFISLFSVKKSHFLNKFEENPSNWIEEWRNPFS